MVDTFGSTYPYLGKSFFLPLLIFHTNNKSGEEDVYERIEVKTEDGRTTLKKIPKVIETNNYGVIKSKFYF